MGIHPTSELLLTMNASVIAPVIIAKFLSNIKCLHVYLIYLVISFPFFAS